MYVVKPTARSTKD